MNLKWPSVLGILVVFNCYARTPIESTASFIYSKKYDLSYRGLLFLIVSDFKEYKRISLNTGLGFSCVNTFKQFPVDTSVYKPNTSSAAYRYYHLSINAKRLILPFYVKLLLMNGQEQRLSASLGPVINFLFSETREATYYYPPYNNSLFDPGPYPYKYKAKKRFELELSLAINYSKKLNKKLDVVFQLLAMKAVGAKKYYSIAPGIGLRF